MGFKSLEMIFYHVLPCLAFYHPSLWWLFGNIIPSLMKHTQSTSIHSARNGRGLSSVTELYCQGRGWGKADIFQNSQNHVPPHWKTCSAEQYNCLRLWYIIMYSGRVRWDERISISNLTLGLDRTASHAGTGTTGGSWKLISRYEIDHIPTCLCFLLFSTSAWVGLTRRTV